MVDPAVLGVVGRGVYSTAGGASADTAIILLRGDDVHVLATSFTARRRGRGQQQSAVQITVERRKGTSEGGPSSQTGTQSVVPATGHRRRRHVRGDRRRDG